jgi:hypothetical protein
VFKNNVKNRTIKCGDCKHGFNATFTSIPSSLKIKEMKEYEA